MEIRGSCFHRSTRIELYARVPVTPGKWGKKEVLNDTFRMCVHVRTGVLRVFVARRV